MNNKILIGKIVGTSGIKGYVRVRSFCESPNDFSEFDYIYDHHQNEFYISKIISTRGSIAIINIRGINSLSAAEKLIGTELYIDREHMKALDDGSYYYTDLIGMDVYLNGQHYGVVVDVVNYGASDIIEVQEIKTKELVMYPFTDDFIEEVDQRRISLKAVEKF